MPLGLAPSRRLRALDDEDSHWIALDLDEQRLGADCFQNGCCS
jgi:hypothetical protein